MAKKVDLTFLANEHETLLPKCRALCVEMARQLEHLVNVNKISLALPIQFRAKTIESINDKILQGRYNIKKSILELQDWEALRVVVLFKRDTERIAKFVKENFDVVSQYGYYGQSLPPFQRKVYH
jgi:ppGpp synthetase/RelA/SpoT-type nucleotidyltranferase